VLHSDYFLVSVRCFALKPSAHLHVVWTLQALRSAHRRQALTEPCTPETLSSITTSKMSGGRGCFNCGGCAWCFVLMSLSSSPSTLSKELAIRYAALSSPFYHPSCPFTSSLSGTRADEGFPPSFSCRSVRCNTCRSTSRGAVFDATMNEDSRPSGR
jgi:hypothetical protein